ncbi:helix-turn-helix domain-containing protein [Vibrio alfacsensis]|uniref:helix-turn-helix domain-containing protein n=1 Tax=Vibrio alfacsensis TaxID=1074311 RepID=UPI004067933D
MKNNTVRSKLAFLRLAEELGNVSKACNLYGYSRDSYYRLKKLYEQGGEAALVEQVRAKPLLRNRVAKDIQSKLIEFTFEHPELGQKKVADALSDQGYVISPNGVRSVWLRYDLETKKKRLTALKVKIESGQVTLSEKQIAALNVQANSLKNAAGQLDTQYPGDLLVQDTIKFDYFPQLGTVYLHLAIDSFSRFAFALFSDCRNSETATRLLSNQVIPFLTKYHISVKRVLTDRGGEFLASASQSPFQQFLTQQSIEHVKIKAYNSSKINGLCFEYMQHIMRHFCTPAARQYSIKTIDDLSMVFQQWLNNDNYQREDTSAYCFGKTHYETLTGHRFA